MKNYTDILHQHNLKATPQRLAIANALELKGHLTLEELYGMMLEKFSSLSLATIYKNINIMVENAFIQEVKLPQMKSVYELSKSSHAHLVCKECEEIMDVTLDLDHLHISVEKLKDFKIESSDLVLSGVCKNCQ